MNREKSNTVFNDLCKVIPGGVSSPVRAMGSLGMTPIVAASGKDDLLTDVDGNTFIDYCMSWGALILGHANDAIIKNVERQLLLGSSFGMTTPYEKELAATISNMVPSIEMVRFVSSGTEATMSATRLARGYTKRSKVITFSGCYHGHADYFLVQAGSGVSQLPQSSSAGINQNEIASTINLPYNDLEALEKIFENREITDDLACVIIEPIAANMGVVEPDLRFLKRIRELTQKVQALLIFDEVISGFRVHLAGAQGLYGITPDLTTFGKVVGGGFPLACFGGKKEIMCSLAPLGPVYQAGTLSGNPVAVIAGTTQLHYLQRDGFYEELEAKTRIITDEVKRLQNRYDLPICCNQVGSLFTIFFGKKKVRSLDDVKGCDFEMFGRFYKAMFSEGIFLSPSQYEANFVSFSHTKEHLEKTRDAICHFLHQFGGQTLQNCKI